MVNTKQGGEISKLSQIAKYGGEEGYRAEMSRRASMRKNIKGGFSNPKVAKLAQQKSVEVRKANAKIQKDIAPEG